MVFGVVAHGEQPAVVLGAAVRAGDEDGLAGEVGVEVAEGGALGLGVDLEDAGAERGAALERAGDRPAVAVGAGPVGGVDGGELAAVLGELALLDAAAVGVEDEAGEAGLEALLGGALDRPVDDVGAGEAVHAGGVDDEVVAVLEGVGEVEDEAGVGMEAADLGAAAREHEDLRGAGARAEGVGGRVEAEEELREVEGGGGEEEDAVVGGEGEVVHEAHRREDQALALHAGASGVLAVEHQGGLAAGDDAEVVEVAGGGVKAGVGGVGQLGGHPALEQGPVVAQGAAEVVAGEGVEGAGVDAMGQAALPQGVEAAAVHDDGGVGGVLEPHPQEVLVEAAGDVGAEVAEQDLAGGLLGEELPGAHVTVAVEDAGRGGGIGGGIGATIGATIGASELEAVEVAVAVEGVGVALAVELQAAGAVADEHAAQADRDGALDHRERGVDLVGDGLVRAEVDVGEVVRGVSPGGDSGHGRRPVIRVTGNCQSGGVGEPGAGRG